ATRTGRVPSAGDVDALVIERLRELLERRTETRPVVADPHQAGEHVDEDAALCVAGSVAEEVVQRSLDLTPVDEGARGPRERQGDAAFRYQRFETLRQRGHE